MIRNQSSVVRPYILILFLVASILIGGFFPSASHAQSDGLDWETVNLDLDVSFHPSEERIKVSGVLRVKLLAPTSLGPTILLNSRVANMTFNKVEVNGASSIQLNKKLAGRKAVRLAKVRFDEPLRRGTELDVNFEYESSGGSGQFGINDQAAIGSWVDTWHPIPLFDRRSSTSLSSASKSVGTTTLRLPPSWRGAAEGKLDSREKSDSGWVEVWTCKTPIARSFAAGKYMVASEKVGDRNISIYRLSHEGVSPQRLAHSVADVLVSLEQRYGSYPYKNYSIIETPNELGQFGAASLQGMIYVKPRYFGFEGGSLPLFAHEMAHGWWGNLVGTRGPGSILCDESLAQYSAAIAIESNLGTEAATEFMRFSREDYIPNQCAWGYFEIWRQGNDAVLSKMGSGGTFHDLSDAKGHWVYHMLRRRVGDEVFFATLRSFIADYADKQISLDDVRSAFIKSAPNAELKQFFSQWLDQRGAPILDVSFLPDGDKRINVVVEQQQPGKPYHLQLDLGLTFGDEESTTHRVGLKKRKQTFTIAVERMPIAVIADPEHRLLIWTPEYGDNPLSTTKEVVASKLSVEQLQIYAGDFAVEGLGQIRFTVKDGELMAKVPNEPQHAMQHIEGHEFKSGSNIVTFQIEDGRATQFVAKKGVQKLIGKRTNDD